MKFYCIFNSIVGSWLAWFCLTHFISAYLPQHRNTLTAVCSTLFKTSTPLITVLKQIPKYCHPIESHSVGLAQKKPGGEKIQKAYERSVIHRSQDSMNTIAYYCLYICCNTKIYTLSCPLSFSKYLKILTLAISTNINVRLG